MSIKYSEQLRNAQLDAIETTIGPNATLQLRTGNPPAGTASADTGTLLVELALPANWLADASGGTKGIANGPWTGTGVAAGDVGHFRLKDEAGSVCHVQGTVTQAGNGGDMIMANIGVAVGQLVNVSACQITAPNS